MRGPLLEVRALTVSFPGTVAVDKVDLAVHEGEVVAVLGPSGCGKSTLLRAIAGLEHPDAGSIHLGGRDLSSRRPDQRGVGLMFQDGALFPHRTVAQNVAFGPRMQGLARDEIAARVEDALRLVGLADYGDRATSQLSGGEQQRVALARAMAPRPRMLLLDEPLGSLDRALRDRLLEELPRLFDQLGVTVLYVTHDQDEALALADRVAVMRAGRIVQVGTPGEVWRDPVDGWVAAFLGVRDVLDVEVRDAAASTPLGEVPTDLEAGPAALVVLPGALTLDAPDGDGHPGQVRARGFAGDHVVLTVELSDGTTVHVPVWAGTAPEIAATVRVQVEPQELRVVPRG